MLGSNYTQSLAASLHLYASQDALVVS